MLQDTFSPMAPAVSRRLFTTAEYTQMTQAGILSPDDRVELIKGEIVKMAAMGSPHASCIRRLDRLFNRILEDKGIVSTQTPIHLNKYSEPEPDITLLQPREDFYESSHPEPEDVLLVIEVSESSLEFDRKVKLPLYAQANIPEVWIVNLVGKLVEVHRQPSAEGYEQTLKLRRDETISPLAFPQLIAHINDILGISPSL